MPITKLQNDSESVLVKVFANKTSHFVASWYQPLGRNLVELTSEIEMLRSQLEKIKGMHKGNTPPLSPCSGGQRVVVNGVKSDWVPVVSGVPRGTVLGPLLLSLHINDIMSGIESEIRLFADDCVCYREIKKIEDTLKL